MNALTRAALGYRHDRNWNPFPVRRGLKQLAYRANETLPTVGQQNVLAVARRQSFGAERATDGAASMLVRATPAAISLMSRAISRFSQFVATVRLPAATRNLLLG